MLQHFIKEQRRLLHHRRLEDVIILRIERAIRRSGVDGAEAEPLADEVFGEGLRPGIAQHALDLLAEYARLTQPVLRGKLEKRLVRHGTPEEVGEPAGESVVVERCWWRSGCLFAKKQ